MTAETTIRHPDGRVKLHAPEEVRGSRLHNEDLAPMPVAKCTWSTWDYAALWISMAHCIPTYTLVLQDCELSIQNKTFRVNCNKLTLLSRAN